MVDGAHRGDALCVGAARPGVQVGHEAVAQPQVGLHGGAGVAAVAPRLLGVEHRARRVEAVDGGEAAELDPAGRHLVVPDPEHVPADVVGPPVVADIGGCRGELGLEAQGVPGGDGVPGEADGRAVAGGVGETGEGDGAAAVALHPAARPGAGALAPGVQVVDVVEHPQRVQARDIGVAALLPVQPPEVDAVVLQRVVGELQVGVGEVLVTDVEGDGLARGRVPAEPAHHGGVGGLVAADAGGGVEVEGHLHAAGVQGVQEAPGVGEEIGVPGVAGPPVADRRVDVHQVPVHVEHRYREGQPLGREAVHEGEVGLLGVAVVAAPPVAQERPRDQRSGAGQAEEVPQRPAVVLPVAEQVQVVVRGGAVHGARARARPDPLVLLEEQGGGVVDDGQSGQREDPGAQPRPAVDVVQGAAGAAQVGREGLVGVPLVPEPPGSAVQVDNGGAHGHAQPRAGEPSRGLIGQVEVLGEDLHAVLAAAHVEGGGLAQVAGDDQLGGGVGELARPGALHADEPVGQDGEAGVVAHPDDRLRPGGRRTGLRGAGGERRGHGRQPFLITRLPRGASERWDGRCRRYARRAVTAVRQGRPADRWGPGSTGGPRPAPSVPGLRPPAPS